MTEEPTVQLSIPNVPAATKAKLEALAKKEDRSLSNYLRILLEKHIQATEAFGLAEADSPTPIAA